jgi:hypothetical protein
MIIDGRFWQGAYRSESVALLDAHYYAAYHAIATEIVDAQTPDEVLEDLIPTTICMFQKKVQWQGWESAEFMKKVLHGPIEEWKGKRLLMAADILEIPQSPRIEPPPLLPVSPPGPAGQSSLKHCTRRSEVDAFLEKCNRISRTRIRRRHLWLSLGHTTPRQFEYWQACNEEKATADFGPTLRKEPQHFLDLLKEKRLIP